MVMDGTGGGIEENLGVLLDIIIADAGLLHALYSIVLMLGNGNTSHTHNCLRRRVDIRLKMQATSNADNKNN